MLHQSVVGCTANSNATYNQNGDRRRRMEKLRRLRSEGPVARPFNIYYQHRAYVAVHKVCRRFCSCSWALWPNLAPLRLVHPGVRSTAPAFCLPARLPAFAPDCARPSRFPREKARECLKLLRARKRPLKSLEEKREAIFKLQFPP